MPWRIGFRSTLRSQFLPGLDKKDIKERAGMSRYLFDEIVATSRDLSNMRAGTTERGGKEGLGAVFSCACACRVEAKRNVVEAFRLGKLHRVRTVKGFPGRPISLRCDSIIDYSCCRPGRIGPASLSFIVAFLV